MPTPGGDPLAWALGSNPYAPSDGIELPDMVLLRATNTIRKALLIPQRPTYDIDFILRNLDTLARLKSAGRARRSLSATALEVARTFRAQQDEATPTGVACTAPACTYPGARYTLVKKWLPQDHVEKLHHSAGRHRSEVSGRSALEMVKGWWCWHGASPLNPRCCWLHAGVSHARVK